MDVNQTSPAATKVALFRSLFRGREDVYPRRFESRKTGKSGYAPACANEWARGICEKPRIKCAVCPNRGFLPVTDDVIRWHLSGHDDQDRPFVAGVYPLLLDETCFFLAVDFDKTGWQADARAFLQGCRRLGVPAAVERSRSGRGGHVWLFFEAAIPAALARRLGSHLLTEAMEDRPDIGLDSYDRLFPNQDTMPQGGFGDLIALPLQKGPRDQGNSVFVDDDGMPWADQWACLAAVRKIARFDVEQIVQDAERRGRVSASVCHHRRTEKTSRGRRCLLGEDRKRDSPNYPRRWNSFWGIRFTSRRKGCTRDFGTDSFGSPPFRIPSSTRRRRCGCRRTTASRDRMRRRSSAAHWLAPWLSRRSSAGIEGFEPFDRSCATSATGAERLRRRSTALCAPNSSLPRKP